VWWNGAFLLRKRLVYQNVETCVIEISRISTWFVTKIKTVDKFEIGDDLNNTFRAGFLDLVRLSYRD
jgi:hypothetical protein